MSHILSVFFCLLGTLYAVTAAAENGELLVDYERPDGVRVLQDSNPKVVAKSVLGREHGWLAPSQDPYEEAAWKLPLPGLEKHAGETVILELHFFDAGAGLLEAALEWPAAQGSTTIAPGRRRAYTRCNTEIARFAAYEFALPASAGPLPPTLRVTGLEYPIRVVVKPKQEAEYWDALKAALPRREAKPLIDLHHSMRLTTTAGLDVMGGLEALESSLEQLQEYAPLMRALGMTSIEGYVTWKRLEPSREGEFDFSFYDAIVHKLAEYDLTFFPLLIVGSGYALPEWFIKSPENTGFTCLEHGKSNPIQSIWNPSQKRHVERVLKAFGDHYGPMGVLDAVRLGPSGNFGESQYPAGGNWGPRGEEMHIHIGWWAGDAFARGDYRRFLTEKFHTEGTEFARRSTKRRRMVCMAVHRALFPATPKKLTRSFFHTLILIIAATFRFL